MAENKALASIKELWEKQIKPLWDKTTQTQKIILGVVVVVVLVGLFSVGMMSSGQGKVVLYSRLTATDFAKVTEKLSEKNVSFSTSGTHTIFLDPKVKDSALKDKYVPHYFDFLFEYGSDSGNIPAC